MEKKIIYRDIYIVTAYASNYTAIWVLGHIAQPWESLMVTDVCQVDDAENGPKPNNASVWATSGSDMNYYFVYRLIQNIKYTINNN